MDIDFIALYVETANENYSSICQVGLAFFKDGHPVDTWESYVDPDTYFSPVNISIHGITPELVKGSMLIPEMYDHLTNVLTGKIIVHHMPFDRVALSRCAESANRPKMPCKWLDTAYLARHTWEEVKRSGYGLSALSARFDIPHHGLHNALDDALAAGYLCHKAIGKSNSSFADWIIDQSDSQFITNQDGKRKKVFGKCPELKELATAEPDPNGILYGEVVVFTGELALTRLEAARIAYSVGCNIDLGVTRNTTMLVVGQQDQRLLAGHEKSSKHRKAEELSLKGQNIRIMYEKDFREIVNY